MKLPTKPTNDDEGNPLPFEDEKGGVIIPMWGKYAIPCLNALLMPAPSKVRRGKARVDKKSRSRSAKDK
jgi:hypothetical protein